MLVAAGLGAAFFSAHLPSSFLPVEDQGYMFLHLQLPNGASLERTEAAAAKVEQVLMHTPGVKYTTSAVGFSLLSFVNTSYTGFFFVTLDDWKDRRSQATQYQEIVHHVNQELSKLPEGFALSFPPPAIPGVGTSGGFTFVLEDRAGRDVPFLAGNVQKFIAAASKRPEIAPGMLTTFLPSVPQKFLSVDREKVLKQGVALNDVYRTVQAYMGGLFVNYFNRFGRQWQVYVEAEDKYRANLDHIDQFYVRNNHGEMVPLSALAHFETRYGPEFTMRYNLYRSAQIIGSAAPGYSSAQAMKALEETFDRTMPGEMGYDYMGMSYQEKKSQQGVPSWAIFAASLLFVFLILAALYESWTLPFSVLLSTPMAVFGAFAALWLRRWVMGLYLPAYRVQIESDVYTADRSRHADRAGGQELDPDRRFRESGVRKRKASGGGGARSSAASPASAADDLVRVYSRLSPALDCFRCRRRRPAGDGHSRDRRHGGRNVPRQVPGSRDLLRGREVLGRECFRCETYTFGSGGRLT